MESFAPVHLQKKVNKKNIKSSQISSYHWIATCNTSGQGDQWFLIGLQLLPPLIQTASHRRVNYLSISMDAHMFDKIFFFSIRDVANRA